MTDDESERAFRARIEAVCPGADSTALHLLPENAAHGVLQVQFPDAFAWLLRYAQDLHDPEVDEAVLDYTEDQ